MEKIPIDWTERPVAPAVQGEWFDALQPQAISLKTERHHRLVAVAGRTEVQLVDSLGKGVGGAKYSVEIDGRIVEGRTGNDGGFVVNHPRAVADCKIHYPEYDSSAGITQQTVSAD